MTLVLQNYLYTFEAYEKYLEKKNKSAARGASAKKVLESQTPDWREPVDYKPYDFEFWLLFHETPHWDLCFFFPRNNSDPQITQADWDYPTAQSIWYDLLEIFRPLNSWEDPSFYHDGMECLCTVVDMLLTAYNRADYLEDLCM